MGKVRKEDPRQKPIDYTRGEQLAIFRRLPIPPVILEEGKDDKRVTREVSPRDIFDVLRVLDDHGVRSWPSIATICREARMPRSSVIRGIKALSKLGWVIIEKKPKRHGGFVNSYTVVWTELDAATPRPTTVPTGNRDNRSRFPQGTSTSSHGELVPVSPGNTNRPVSAKKTSTTAEWRKVEEDFRTHLGAVGRLVKKYKNDGLSPEDLRAKLEEGLATVGMAANVGKFTSPSGAVFAWIENGVWPAPQVISIEHERERQHSVAVMNQQRVAKEEADAERAAAFDAKMAALEAEHGATLDAMSGREQAALLDNQLATALIKRGNAKAVRPQLLEALAGRTASVG